MGLELRGADVRKYEIYDRYSTVPSTILSIWYKTLCYFIVSKQYIMLVINKCPETCINPVCLKEETKNPELTEIGNDRNGSVLASVGRNIGLDKVRSE